MSDFEEGVVSICVPIYNTSPYLKRCVDSLLAQTYPLLELVLVNDGSTDDCAQICDDYALADVRVKVLHKENGGESTARNAGLQAARGEFIMFMDSDDEYLPQAVESLLHAFHHKDIDLAIGGYLERRGEVEHFATGHLRTYTIPQLMNEILSSCPFGISYLASTVNGKMFRHDFLHSHHITFDERFVVGNDSIFMCQCFKYVKKVYDIFSPVYIYYKFHAEERVQGMSWFYPDTFFLTASVRNQYIVLLEEREEVTQELLMKEYKELCNKLINAALNHAYFKDPLTLYLSALSEEVDFFQQCAHLVLAQEDKDQEEDIPFKSLSKLIVAKDFDALQITLQELASKRVKRMEHDLFRPMLQLNR